MGNQGNLGSTYYFSDTIGSTASRVIGFGRTNDEVLVGDWDGDGTDTLTVRREHYFFIMNRIAGGEADTVIAYGRRGDQVLVGDWDGDGTDTLAVRRGNTYYLINSMHEGEADTVLAYGRPDDQVLVGDWDGDGKDTLAVRRGHMYYIANSLTGGQADLVVGYGRPDDQVLVGDWDGDGKDTLTVRRGNTFYVKNAIADGNADRAAAFGRSTDMPLAGDWNGDGKDTFALRRPPDPPRPVQTLFTFNVATASQPNNFFCGPTSGFMILRYLGENRSHATGQPLSIENVATAMSTRAYGYTSFNDRKFQTGMNAWLGRDLYTTVHTPSPATVVDAATRSFRNGYPMAVDEQERRGGPHFNGHNNSTFSHIMVVTGYNTATDAVQFADPGAGTIWPGAAATFWYPSLRAFTINHLATEIVLDGRQHIGIYTTR